MESVTSVLKNTARVTRKRTVKSKVATQPKETGNRRRRGARNMQQKQQAALAETMKENCTILHQQLGPAMSTTEQRQQPLAPRGGSVVQLSCKENMGQAVQPPLHHPMTRSRRQQQSQQQQQVCTLQCTEMELAGGECVNMDDVASSMCSHGGSVLGVAGGNAATASTIPVEHVDYLTTAVGANSGLVGSYGVPAPSLALPPRPPGFDFHPTNPATSIHLLQGGSLHGLPSVGGQGFTAATGGMFTPLPDLQWARSSDLWRRMRLKDVTRVAPETELRMQHPNILPNMRVILLDWMMEVCEEYKLHRETYYLAVDMYDRFMDAQTGIQKEQLQLIGVTCLFISSKIEEIYPPRVNDFAYVTDGACSISNILDTELFICKALCWKLNHHMVTVNTWVNTYMQLGSHHLRPNGIKAREFEYPAYSSLEFVRVMQLLDLCTLDIASRQFSSSVLAASAVYLASERSRSNLEVITGLELSDIHVCVNWMQPCAAVISQRAPFKQRTFSGVIPQDSHNIQTHEVSISMLDDASEMRKSQESIQSQYTLLQDCSVFMTPPRQERKCLAPINTAC